MNDDIHDLSGSYALDALDDLERARFAAHLAKCPTCQRDVADFRAAAAHLGRAAAEQPPAHLRAGVLSAIKEVRQERAGATVAARRRRTPWLSAAAGVAAAGVIGVLGVQLASVRDQRDESADLAEVLAAPDAETALLGGAAGSGRVVSSASVGRSVLVLDGLPAIPDDRAYQLWFVTDGEEIPAGVYRPEGERVVETVDGVPADVDALAVTEEPASGSEHPTGPVLLSGEAAG